MALTHTVLDGHVSLSYLDWVWYGMFLLRKKREREKKQVHVNRLSIETHPLNVILPQDFWYSFTSNSIWQQGERGIPGNPGNPGPKGNMVLILFLNKNL